MKFELQDGLKVGIGSDTVVHKSIEIGRITTALMFDAREAAERPMETPGGYQLAISPTRLHIELLRRRIKYIGDIQGPISERELKSLSDDDMEIIATRAQQLDEADEVPTDPRTHQESAAD